MLFALKIDFKIDACLQLQNWSENRFLINVLDFWEKQGIFQNYVRKKVGDAHSHGLTILKMCSPTLLQCLPTQVEGKIFSCDNHRRGECQQKDSEMGSDRGCRAGPCFK